MADSQVAKFDSGTDIAIIGMSGRFPGARNVDEFWHNLRDGIESITQFTDEELLAAGVDAAVLSDPSYVRAGAVLENVELFDASFFGLTPREAQVTDPQQRLFLEEAWNVIEAAGYDPTNYNGSIGVFAGVGLSTYLLNNLAPNLELVESVGRIGIALGNDKDSLTTRVAYLLDLRGPCYTIQTYCSTSLVAISTACESLLGGLCDMALAGGVLVTAPQKAGYFYQEGGIASPDGRCRAFDAKAKGAPLGNGVAVVLLKRLEDAIADGDTIHAVVKGSAINNDGALRAGYTAPGVRGQTGVILEALANAEVDAQSISYIETHGTGTALGDAIEFQAMNRSFAEHTNKKGFCAIGSVKTNVGHLDRAAGVTGLIKTVLSLKHQLIPPSLNYTEPNPDIDFSNTPFYVNTQLQPWPLANDWPRRAGVSSFGMGGTNAHVILEEAPSLARSEPLRPYQLLLFSAKTDTALDTATANLQQVLREQPDMNMAGMADMAYTLQVGRKPFEHRRILVCQGREDALAGLADLARLAGGVQATQERPIAFMFPGVGDHYVDMARELYHVEPVFRETLDSCCDLLRPILGLELRALLYSDKPQVPAAQKLDLRRMLRRDTAADELADDDLSRTEIVQPTVFVIEYALAQLLQSWGIVPDALIGHSLGEYVAACIAGVLSLPDALTLVAQRAQLIQSLPTGSMLAVPLSQEEVQPYLSAEVNLAVVNGPQTCVLAGPLEAVARLEIQLGEQDVASRRLSTRHAFHSAMMAPIVDQFTAVVQAVRLNPPQIPYLSNVTGCWISDGEATDPAYWARHLCQTVRFGDGLAKLLHNPEQVLLEVGPGQSLGSFAKQHPDCQREQWSRILPTLRYAYDPHSDEAFLLETVGRLWLAGLQVDWQRFYGAERRQRIPLPTYPFERQRYWIDPPQSHPSPSPRERTTGKKADVADWFYTPEWAAAAVPSGAGGESQTWLVFEDDLGWGRRLGERLHQHGHTVVRVLDGDTFAERAEGLFTIRSDVSADYALLLNTLAAADRLPTRVAHAWNLSAVGAARGDAESFATAQRVGFYSLLHLIQAMDAQAITAPMHFSILSNGVQPVGDGPIYPEKTTFLGLCRVVPQEYQNIRCRSVDIDLPADEQADVLLAQLAAELMSSASDVAVAYRAGVRYVQTHKPKRLAKEVVSDRLRPGGVYLIIGGLGAIGLILARYLAGTVQARLVLTSRSGLPPRDTWAERLTQNDRIAHTIHQVQSIEAMGAEVLVLAADAGDEPAMRSVIAHTSERFDALHGVIHAAGLTGRDAFQPIQTLDQVLCEAHFRAKAHGLYVLDRVLQSQKLDFCMLFSSLSSVLGGLGFAAYAAANTFMDAYAHAHNRAPGLSWTSVNWDTWKVSAAQAAATSLGATVTEFEMTPEEGTQAFALALGDGSAQLINSTGDLMTRIRQWVMLEALTQQPVLTLATSDRPELASAYVPATNQSERRIAAIWQQVLGIDQIGVHDNFFDLGGNSLIGLQLVSRIQKEFDVQIPAVALFEAPTVSTLARYLQPDGPTGEDRQAALLVERRLQTRHQGNNPGIAVIGMTGRFPGAKSVEQFWQNLCEGRETIATFTDQELLEAGVSPALVNDPNYVRRRPIIDDVAMFDATFFRYSPREAELMDPQHRLFLECSWEALELAGYSSEKYKGLIGVFGGTNISTYLLQLSRDPRLAQSINEYQAVIGNDKDSLTTAVSYKLNLKGPSFAVQTFCSTSLVATHLACQSLLNGECDIALAGGVSIRVPQKRGHLYEEGGMESPDGHCRTFDARAQGTLFGDGVGVLVLKRLADALADGDTIHAMLRGSAINNDGSLKVGYTAPSVAGQAEVVAMAQANANVHPETIGYLEAHGTATKLGDPIEVASLTQAFRRRTDKKNYCAIGSVKTNLGHLDRASGVTGLIKAILAVKHGLIPAHLHYATPNPEIDFDNSPFYVNTQLSPWSRQNGTPRRAGVNSLGMGGTNAHIVVEEPPLVEPSGPSRLWQLLLLSAHTESALNTATVNLAQHLDQHPDVNLADVAYTLQVGRTSFEHRRMVVCQDTADARSVLEPLDPRRVLTHHQRPISRPVVFMFPGVGDHYLHMAKELYETELIFRQTIERCCEALAPYLGAKLRDLLYPAVPVPAQSSKGSNGVGSGGGLDLRAMLGRNNQQTSLPAAQKLYETAVAQPLVFAVEYALARLLMSWGLRPQALLGYSLGEYVAACVSGVLSLEDTLKLVAARARLIQESPSGSMLAVSLSDEDVQPLLSDEISLASHNGPAMCVLAGVPDAVDRLEARLTQQGTACRRLPTTHAFHSPMLLPLVDSLTDLVRTVTLHPPQIPYISNVTGTWITSVEATDPSYWARHMCQPVRFTEALGELLQERDQILLEVGPGQALGSLAKQHPDCTGEQVPLILPTMRYAYEHQSDVAFLLGTLGQLWLLGLELDWSRVNEGEVRHRLPLPSYPFEGQQYWLEPRHERLMDAAVVEAARSPEETLAALPRQEVSDWFCLPGWKQTAPHRPSPPQAETCWLLYIDGCGLGDQVAEWLSTHGQQVVLVQPGRSFEQLEPQRYVVRPRMRPDYDTLLREMQQQGLIPDKIVHLWSVTPGAQETADGDHLEQVLDLGLYSIMALVQALGERNLATCDLAIVSSNVQAVTGNEPICPEKATVLGPGRVVPLEYANISCRTIDVVLPDADSWQMKVLLANLLGELTTDVSDPVVALRGHQRWVEMYEPLRIPATTAQDSPRLRQHGVYLITGGLGGIGLAMAEHLARAVQARLILISRSALPPDDQWTDILATQGASADVRRKIQGVQALEALGAEVLIAAADVADEGQMQAVVAQALARFGTIHGVIHAAGVPGIGLTQLKTPEAAAQVLAPKVMGTLVLEHVLQDVELDWLVLFSSITSMTGGGPGQIDYCAANAFLDAYAQHHMGEKRLTRSINWGEWQWNAWDEGLSSYNGEVQEFFRSNRQQFGIRFEEGADAFSRVLSSDLPQVVVSTQDFRQVLQLSTQFTAATILARLADRDGEVTLHPRPQLMTRYVPPDSETEQRIVKIWQNVLGVEGIGVHDNFLELGGNSLLGTQLVSRLRQTFQVNLPLSIVLEALTVGEQAIAVEMAIISELDSLVEEEVVVDPV